MTDTVELAEKLIRIDTETPVEDKEDFEVILSLMEENSVDYRFHEFDGVLTLTASFGNGEPHICLNGHLDVVPAGENWEITDPYSPEIKDGRLYGRGASDMKGGLAASINAFLRLKSDEEFSGRATLMVPGDEEQGGARGTEKLLEEENNFDYALIAEPTDMQIQVGFRGKCHLDVMLEGEGTHASRPHLVENIVENDLPRAIEALKDLKWAHDGKLPLTTSTVTQIETYGPRNSIPGKVRIGMDIRNNTAYGVKDIVESIQDSLPEELDYSIELSHTKPPVMVEDVGFIAKLEEATEELRGEKPSRVTEGGSSDGAHFSRYGIPSLEIGPEQEPIHAPDEYCSVKYLEQLEEIFYRTARKLDRGSTNPNQH